VQEGPNPKGIESSSPGLRGTSYPGMRCTEITTLKELPSSGLQNCTGATRKPFASPYFGRFLYYNPLDCSRAATNFSASVLPFSAFLLFWICFGFRISGFRISQPGLSRLLRLTVPSSLTQPATPKRPNRKHRPLGPPMPSHLVILALAFVEFLKRIVHGRPRQRDQFLRRIAAR
jgi:hypothetical protein